MRDQPRTTARAQDVYAFWVDEVGEKRWYKPDSDLDRTIKERFEADWARAAAGGYREWLLGGIGSLALILLLDQFPRNMFRGRAEAFSTDDLALATARVAIGRDLDQQVPEPVRQFFFLPFMHSERLADQERGMRLFRLRTPICGDDNIKHGILHRAVIRRFGRFPSRNAALGRRDREAELAYRAEGGYMSG